ncbi:MAG: B12-binding domain-containing radical SAM protein [Aliidongia sp.]
MVPARRVLCVFPAYSPSFGTFDAVYKMRGVSAFMPPQGLLLIAAYLPETWQVRFIDENMRKATPRDFAWAEMVLVSGMHIQRPQIADIGARAREAGCITVLGGPSVTAAPDWYPDFDYLHLGEIGDATDALVAALAASCERPATQIRLETKDRLAIDALPMPAYHLIELDRYFIASIQFSSGCPYRCEFCDIPALYGRVPRLKAPERVTAELDAILEAGHPPAVYFVDDNFIGNRRAARELLPHLVEWQKRNHYPLQFACEATLNIAQDRELLALMREAYFCTVFVGIETPDADALRAIAKDQNAKLSILDSVATLNEFGMEVVSGIILGLDTDTLDTADRLLAFIEASQIPMLTINLLQALPRTPLWTRLERSGRLIDDPARESNVDFLLPYETVLGMWRRCVATAYSPEAIYRRFDHNARHTYPNRITPDARGRATRKNLGQALRLAANLLVRVGIFADYRRHFWRIVGRELAQGHIEAAFNIALVAHHLITFSRQALAGEQNASFYSAKRPDDPIIGTQRRIA